MTSDTILIGLDAGTSVIKAVAFDQTGAALATASRPNEIRHVSGGGVEQDMNATWQRAAEVLARLVAELGGRTRSVAALAITGQGDGTWLIDADGEPVAPAWLWLDGRAGDIVEELRAGEAGRAVFRRTGTGLNPSNQSGQLLWLQRHRPELLLRAATAFHCKDWLYFKCSGERATDISEGVFTFGDYLSGEYSDEVIDRLGLSDCRRLLPPLVDGSRHHGRLSADAAAASGLPAGLPVVLAPVDILCAALGGGLYGPERELGFTIVGSTGIHMRLYRAPEQIELREQSGYLMRFVAPGTWVGMMSNMAATLNIDWMVDNTRRLLADFGAELSRDEVLRTLDRRAGEAHAGAVLYHPFIFESGERGPFVNPRARAQFLGLTRQSTPYQLMRAVYDSLGLAARDCYDSMGQRPAEVRVGGGAMRSAVMRSIVASALDTPLRLVDQPEAGAAGAAMIAALSLGMFADADAACRRWVQPKLGERIEPDPALAEAYAALLPVYRAGYRRMDDFWHALAAYRRRESAS